MTSNDDSIPDSPPPGRNTALRGARERMPTRPSRQEYELPYPMITRFNRVWQQMDAFAQTLDWKTPQKLNRHFKVGAGYSLNFGAIQQLSDGEYAEAARPGQLVGLLKAMDRVIGSYAGAYDYASARQPQQPLDLSALRGEIHAICSTIEAGMPPRDHGYER